MNPLYRSDPSRHGAADERRAGAPSVRAQPRSTRWNSWPGRRATRPASSSSSRRAESSAALMPVRATSASRLDRVEAEGGEHRIGLAGARRLGRSGAAGGRRAGEAELLEDVAGAVDQLGALLQQGVAAARLRRVDRAGNREHLAAGLGGQPGGDQRAGRSAASTTRVPRARPAMMRFLIGKFCGQRRRADRELADQQAGGGDAVRQRAVPCRVDDGPGRCRRPRSCCRRPPASSAPSWAAPSMPSARPETTTSPARLRWRRRRGRSPAPCAVGLRLPTMAIASAAEQFDPALRRTAAAAGRRSRAARRIARVAERQHVAPRASAAGRRARPAWRRAGRRSSGGSVASAAAAAAPTSAPARRGRGVEHAPGASRRRPAGARAASRPTPGVSTQAQPGGELVAVDHRRGLPRSERPGGGARVAAGPPRSGLREEVAGRDRLASPTGSARTTCARTRGTRTARRGARPAA